MLKIMSGQSKIAVGARSRGRARQCSTYNDHICLDVDDYCNFTYPPFFNFPSRVSFNRCLYFINECKVMKQMSFACYLNINVL